MTTPAGYSNTFFTTDGTANFWVLTSLNFSCVPANPSSVTMSLNLSGFASASDAASGCNPMGIYSFSLILDDIVSIFSGAQTLLLGAIINSSNDWTGTTYVPAVP